jgi:hypothetical protein
MLRISFQSDPRVIEGLKTKGSQIVQTLSVKLTALMLQLSSYVVSRKLSGQILHRVTGVLAGSVQAVPTVQEGTRLIGAVESSGGVAFYGRIFELGEAAHGGVGTWVVPVKARALSFVTHGQRVFATRVLRPPLAARPFMSTSLAENAEKIRAELNAALDEVLPK